MIVCECNIKVCSTAQHSWPGAGSEAGSEAGSKAGSEADSSNHIDTSLLLLEVISHKVYHILLLQSNTQLKYKEKTPTELDIIISKYYDEQHINLLNSEKGWVLA